MREDIRPCVIDGKCSFFIFHSLASQQGLNSSEKVWYSYSLNGYEVKSAKMTYMMKGILLIVSLSVFIQAIDGNNHSEPNRCNDYVCDLHGGVEVDGDDVRCDSLYQYWYRAHQSRDNFYLKIYDTSYFLLNVSASYRNRKRFIDEPLFSLDASYLKSRTPECSVLGVFLMYDNTTRLIKALTTNGDRIELLAEGFARSFHYFHVMFKGACLHKCEGD